MRLAGPFVAVSMLAAVGCAGDPSRYAAENASYKSSPAPAGDAVATASPDARPGLGTEWGDTRKSTISKSTFSRADKASPFATGLLFYNDEENAKQMANIAGFRRTSEGEVALGGGIATLRLKDGAGRFLSGFEASGKKFVVGTSGDHYSIVITSHVPARIEVVVSVDGLDVMDGQEAAFTKRGYLIDPHGELQIEGFRQSAEAVAEFRFGSVKESYAEKKHGDSRNVGVIGVALFNEKGTNPSTWPIASDAHKRLDADPFPGANSTPGH